MGGGGGDGEAGVGEGWRCFRKASAFRVCRESLYRLSVAIKRNTRHVPVGFTLQQRLLKLLLSLLFKCKNYEKGCLIPVMEAAAPLCSPMVIQVCCLFLERQTCNTNNQEDVSWFPHKEFTMQPQKL